MQNIKLRLDVNLIPGQLCSQFCILSLVADCQRKLVVRDNNRTGAVFLAENGNAENGGRCQCLCNKFLRLFAVGNDIDFFSVEFRNNGRNPGTLRADAGTDGIYIGIL